MSKSGNWSTSSYWTPNGVPSSSDNVTIMIILAIIL